MIREAIILAGGLGTRLQEEVPDLPKCMAPVAGLPFLTYVIRHLLSQGVEKFIFSLGYRHEVITGFLDENFSYLNFSTVIETKPLGTGGAVKLALDETQDHDILIVNGDTLFQIDVDDMWDLHTYRESVCTVALKPMQDFDRYGVVEIDEDDRILTFREKKFSHHGNINGGIYLLNKSAFLNHPWPEVFSFEKDYLEKFVEASVFAGLIQDKYFIDIGVPPDYARAQHELKYQPLRLNLIDETWSLFLDRDGVINVNKDGSYVFHKGEFVLLPGAIDAISKLSKLFGKIIIVTNQRGIGKGLMDVSALHEIHEHMIEEIEKGGGRIDALYYCAIDDDKHHDRKPNPGMPLEAAHMFPEIDFSKSIMVGDKMSDMTLGRNIGAYTVMIRSSGTNVETDHVDIDLSFNSLLDFANACNEQEAGS